MGTRLALPPRNNHDNTIKSSSSSHYPQDRPAFYHGLLVRPLSCCCCCCPPCKMPDPKGIGLPRLDPHFTLLPPVKLASLTHHAHRSVRKYSCVMFSRPPHTVRYLYTYLIKLGPGMASKASAASHQLLLKAPQPQPQPPRLLKSRLVRLCR